MNGEVKRRSYHSALRADQARQTRARVIQAARELFVQQGYASSTIVSVAERAGVSADTVYHVFGSKGALLKAVLDLAVSGDDQPVAVLDRPDPQAMRAEPDQRRQIAMFARGMTGQLERLRPVDDILRTAAASDADAAALRADIQLRQRRAAMTTIAGWIAANGPLREGMDIDRAAAVIWTLTSPEVHQMLRDTWAWNASDYTDWLESSLASALLPGPPAPRQQN
jgi:AcrR family transcriptional regulator